MSFPLRARATCSTKCPTRCFQWFGLCCGSSPAGSPVVPPADHTSAAHTGSGRGSRMVTQVYSKLRIPTQIMTLSSMDTHYSDKETPLHYLPTQASVSVSTTAEKQVVAFCSILSFFFCSPLHHTQSSVCVCIFTLNIRINFKEHKFVVHIPHTIPEALR